MLVRNVLLRLAANASMERFVRSSRIAARARDRFITGEEIESVIEPVRALNGAKIRATIDHLGESVASKEVVDATVDIYIRLLEIIKNEHLDSNVSIKLTAFGMDIDEDLCYRNVAKLLDHAGPDQFVRIDMESSAYTDATLELFYRLWNEGKYRNTGVVIQAYLYRSAKDIEDLINLGARVRLCKGAYKEPSDIAFPEKKEVDANYVALMKRLLESGNYPAIATHDPNMIEAARTYCKDHSINEDRFEFQLLYGIRRDLQLALAAEGFNVRIYMPFGQHWYPYYMRRLAERPANIWFVLSNVFK